MLDFVQAGMNQKAAAAVVAVVSLLSLAAELLACSWTKHPLVVS